MPRAELNTERMKPKPLEFRVDMLDKGFMHSPHKRKRGESNLKESMGEGVRLHPNFQHSVRDIVDGQ